MSTAVLDDLEQRRALVRAQAIAIADAPRSPRRFSVAPGTRLRPSPRRRSHTRPKPRAAPKVRKPRSRRFIAALVLAAQLVLVVLALTLPAFKVHTVAVTGTELITSDAVRAAAAIPQQSIFTVDTGTIRSRVRALPWVDDAAVTTELPNTVRIAVHERSPAVRLRRLGADTFVADNGATLPADASLTTLWAHTAPLLDDRAGSVQPVDPTLLRLLEITAQRFPVVFGCSVAAYQWGADGIFSIWTSTGWRVVLGHLDTSDALARVPAQLAALGALRGQLDFAHPTFGYVDVENPAGPTAAGSPGLPQEVRAASVPLPSTADASGAGGAAPNALPHREHPDTGPAPTASARPVIVTPAPGT